MTNWSEREINIDCSFLSSGIKYKAEIFRDGIDANINANQYIFETKDVDLTSKLTIRLANGGGVAIHFSPVTLK